MSVFDVFRSRSALRRTADTLLPEQDELDGFVVPTFRPRKLPMTAELERRRREEEIRKKYCYPADRVGG